MHQPSSPRRPRVLPPLQRRMQVESLEDRRLLAIFSVSNLDDSGAGSLRDAITQANLTPAADEIQFTVTGTINIASQLPTITKDLTITGPGSNLLTIDAGDGVNGVFGDGDGWRIFNIYDGNSTNHISVTISAVTLTGGDVPGHGGAIFNRENLSVTSSAIISNAASNYAGGIYNELDGIVIITASSINNNKAGLEGGGIFNGPYGFAKIVESTISGNSAASNGGGIYAMVDSTTSVVNSTLSGNSSVFSGGAIATVFGTLSVLNSTITSNQSYQTNGGSIFIFVGLVTIENSIVANSIGGGDIYDSDYGDSSISGSYNLIEDGSGGSGLTNTITGDPLLGPLADNGGPTWTHALLPGSPAIDAGNPSFAAPPDYDQRGTGFDRIENGRVDIGAFEVQNMIAEDPSLVVTTDLDVVNGFDNLTSLREAILYANSLVGEDTVSFDAGVFGSEQTINLLLGAYQITDALIIDGPGQELLTIDAQDLTRVFEIDDPLVNNEDFEVAITGLLLTRGATDTAPGHSGGAIQASGFIKVTVLQSTITDSSAGGSGGAIDAYEVEIVESTIGGNSAGSGGGMSGVLVSAIDSLIEDNTSSGSGGGIFGNTVTVLTSTIRGNMTTGLGAYGGGIGAYGDVSVTSSTISGNSTTGNTLFGYYLSRNADGGGVASYAGNIEVINSTVSNNSVTGSGALGGGLAAFQGEAIVAHSTITQNGRGGVRAPFGGITLSHTIVANNAGGAELTTSAALDVNYSLIGTTAGLSGGQISAINSGNGNWTDVDPLLGPLADNGGSTYTHALLEGSPAIDAGDFAFLSPPDYDQRGVGFVRVKNGIVDIGAFESSGPTIPGDFDNDGDIDGRDFLAWQRGESPTPYSGTDLMDWQESYNGGALSALSASIEDEYGTYEDDEETPESLMFFNSYAPPVAPPTEVGSPVASELFVESVDLALEELSAISTYGVREFGELVVRRRPLHRPVLN